MLNYLLGPALFCWLAWGIYTQLTQQEDLHAQLAMLKSLFGVKGMLLVCAVLLLMFLQWSLEARKWQLLMQGTHPIPMSAALKSIFTGIAFSMATPYRIGEFAGRVIRLPDGTRVKGTVFTFIGNFAQLTITCHLGSLCLISERHVLHALLSPYHLQYLVVPVIVASLLISNTMLLLFFGSGKILGWTKGIPWLSAHLDKISTLVSVPSPVLTRLYLLSCFRFLIFILQYWIFFHLVGVELHFITVLDRMALLFLGMAFLPVFSLVDLGVRWQFSLLLFKDLSTNVLGISLAVTAVWLVNLILPALIGTFSMIHFKRHSNQPTINP